VVVPKNFLPGLELLLVMGVVFGFVIISFLSGAGKIDRQDYFGFLVKFAKNQKSKIKKKPQLCKPE